MPHTFSLPKHLAFQKYTYPASTLATNGAEHCGYNFCLYTYPVLNPQALCIKLKHAYRQYLICTLINNLP